MAVELTLNLDEKLLTAKFTGEVTLEDCRDALVEAMRTTMFEPNYNQLINLIEAKYIPSISDIAEASKVIATMRNSLQGKIAVVTASKMTLMMAKALKQLAEKEGVIMDAFFAVKAAKAWLRR